MSPLSPFPTPLHEVDRITRWEDKTMRIFLNLINNLNLVNENSAIRSADPDNLL